MDTNTKDKDKDYARLRKVDEVNTTNLYNPHINVKVNTYTKESYDYFIEVTDDEIEGIIKWEMHILNLQYLALLSI